MSTQVDPTAAGEDVLLEATVEATGRAGAASPPKLRWHERRLVIATTVVLVVVGVFVLWEVAAREGWIDTFFWSSPADVIERYRRLASSGRLLEDTVFTMRSAFLGFVLGTAAGMAIGLAMWWSRFASRVAEPLIVATHAIPKVAITPLLVLFFGIGLASKVALVVLSTAVVTALTAHAGVKRIDDDLVTLLYSLGASRRQVFRKVVVPSTMPWIVSALRVNIGLSLTASIVAEMIASKHGLGRMIYEGSAIYEVSQVWVGVFTLAAVAIVMYVAIGAFERIILRGVLHGAPQPGGRR